MQMEYGFVVFFRRVNIVGSEAFTYGSQTESTSIPRRVCIRKRKISGHGRYCIAWGFLYNLCLWCPFTGIKMLCIWTWFCSQWIRCKFYFDLFCYRIYNEHNSKHHSVLRHMWRLPFRQTFRMISMATSDVHLCEWTFSNINKFRKA